jgi:hypothetical protein
MQAIVRRVERDAARQIGAPPQRARARARARSAQTARRVIRLGALTANAATARPPRSATWMPPSASSTKRPGSSSGASVTVCSSSPVATATTYTRSRAGSAATTHPRAVARGEQRAPLIGGGARSSETGIPCSSGGGVTALPLPPGRWAPGRVDRRPRSRASGSVQARRRCRRRQPDSAMQARAAALRVSSRSKCWKSWREPEKRESGTCGTDTPRFGTAWPTRWEPRGRSVRLPNEPEPVPAPDLRRPHAA